MPAWCLLVTTTQKMTTGFLPVDIGVTNPYYVAKVYASRSHPCDRARDPPGWQPMLVPTIHGLVCTCAR